MQKSMKISSNLFNDYVNETRTSIIKKYDTRNRNTIIHHISDFLAYVKNYGNSIPKNSFKDIFKRNNILVPKSNNLDNSLEIDNNINKFKSRRHSVYDIPNMNLKKLKKKCIKNMLNKKYFINIIKKEILNFFLCSKKLIFNE